MADALTRAGAHFGVEAQQSDMADWGAAFAEWVHANNLDSVVTAYAPVGPAAERLAAARATLAEQGISLIQVLRPWDAAAWPHATKGFFTLKKQIATLVEAEQITRSEPGRLRPSPVPPSRSPDAARRSRWVLIGS